MLSILVAMAENRVIGRDNQLPWRLSADLKRFKQLTTGQTIIMGRRTYQSIGRPLPNRRTIVVSRNPDFHAEGVEVAASLDAAIALAQRTAYVPLAANSQSEVFVVGGHELFRLALPRADRLYLTLVHAQVPGDVYFPEFNADDWQLTGAEHHPADAKNDWPFSFLLYTRKPLAA